MANNTTWPRANQAFRVTLTYQSQDIPNNRSYWYWAAEHYQGGSSYGPVNDWRISGFASTAWARWNINYSGWHTLGSGYFWKTHNADGTLASGTLTLSVTTDNEYVIPSGSTSVGVGSGTIPRIPRGPRVNDAGTWKQTVAYVNDNGTWKIAIPYVNDAGTWKIGGG